MRNKKLTKNYRCMHTLPMDTACEENWKVNQNSENRPKTVIWLTLVNFYFFMGDHSSPQKKRNTDLTAFLSMGNYPRLLELPQ